MLKIIKDKLNPRMDGSWDNKQDIGIFLGICLGDARDLCRNWDGTTIHEVIEQDDIFFRGAFDEGIKILE